MTRLNPYLSFKDNARQAMEFYRGVFGGKLQVSTFKEFHASQDPSEDNRIMHSVLDAGDGIYFMGSDTPSSMKYDEGARISMSLGGEDDAQLSGYFQKLSVGGTVRMPLEKAPWGDKFGMLTDKFGITWMVNIAAKKG
jgi:PhnB protein